MHHFLAGYCQYTDCSSWKTPFYDEPSKFLKEEIYGCTDSWALSSSAKHALIMHIMVYNLRAYVIKASFTSANQNSRCFGFLDRVLNCTNGSDINDYDRASQPTQTRTLVTYHNLIIAKTITRLRKYKLRCFRIYGILNFDSMFNNAVYRRLPHDLEAREYMFRKAFDGLKSISIKGVQKMAELNRID